MQVRFRLEAELRFSAPFTAEAEDVCRMLIDEANRMLFVKGVPKGVDPGEVGHITGSVFSGNILTLTIESGAYTRAHDALFRFRKQVAPTLGKHRLGIREIVVKHYSIEMREQFPENFRIPQLPFIRNAALSDGVLSVDLMVTASDLENRIPDRLVRLFEEKIEAAGGKVEVIESGAK